MPNGNPERWRELCELAILETDQKRLKELFQEIDQLLADSPEEPHAGDGLQADTAPTV